MLLLSTFGEGQVVTSTHFNSEPHLYSHNKSHVNIFSLTVLHGALQRKET